MSASNTAVETARLIAKAADDKQGTEIIGLDVSGRNPFTDIFVLVSADNERQVKSIADEIEDQLIQAGRKIARQEGRSEGRWVLLDYSDVIVHIQHQEDREFYALDRLWQDSPVVTLGVDSEKVREVVAAEPSAATETATEEHDGDA